MGMNVFNRRLLHETELMLIAYIVYERQLFLYWYVTRYLEIDPTHQDVSVQETNLSEEDTVLTATFVTKAKH